MIHYVNLLDQFITSGGDGLQFTRKPMLIAPSYCSSPNLPSEICSLRVYGNVAAETILFSFRRYCQPFFISIFFVFDPVIGCRHKYIDAVLAYLRFEMELLLVVLITGD